MGTKTLPPLGEWKNLPYRFTLVDDIIELTFESGTRQTLDATARVHVELLKPEDQRLVRLWKRIDQISPANVYAERDIDAKRGRVRIFVAYFTGKAARKRWGEKASDFPAVDNLVADLAAAGLQPILEGGIEDEAIDIFVPIEAESEAALAHEIITRHVERDPGRWNW